MRKVLIVASVSEMIEAFLLPNIELLQNMGNEVHVMANFKDTDALRQERINLFKEQLLNRGVISYSLPIHRDPFHIENKRAYHQMKEIIETEQFSIIHCHTPIGGVLTRLAARKVRESGTKVVYTAHGFHFFKGAPLKNWAIFYTIEKMLSKYTDCLITINQEDYSAAHFHKFKTKIIEMIPGVGINPLKFRPVTESKRKYLRQQYGYEDEEFILIYVAELSYRKHQDMLISMMPKLLETVPTARLLLVGDGDQDKLYEYHSLIHELGIEDQVNMLGFRRDVNDLMSLSNVVVSASRQEGLPVNVLEAMSIGLPLVVTDCRGNRDLVHDGENGFVVDIDDTDRFVERIIELHQDKEKRTAFGKENLRAIKSYSVHHVNDTLQAIYQKVFHLIEQDELKKEHAASSAKTTTQ
ncbi:MAG: glycosyltransferase family 4 protein [Desemzia incerta]